ncbi:hypothetical protein BN133_1723 [Cronobacter dublinensis 582]|nr:hypothetical protein BN133_1723 [Cronobacter dublinensis 582]
MAQRVGETLVARRVGRHHVKRPAQIVIQQPEDSVHHVIDMDPGEILAAIADRAAQPEAKQRQQFRHHAAIGRQHRAGAQQADAGALALRAFGNLFPAGAELMGEFTVRGLVLGHHHLAEIAVIAHRRAGEKHRRRFAARCHQRHQLLGYLPAALAQALFLRRRPALVGDGLARQVDDRVEGVEIAEVIQPRCQRHGSVELLTRGPDCG